MAPLGEDRGALGKDEKHGCFIRCARSGRQSLNESRSLISGSPEDQSAFAFAAMVPGAVSFSDWQPPNETATRTSAGPRQARPHPKAVRQSPSVAAPTG